MKIGDLKLRTETEGEEMVGVIIYWILWALAVCFDLLVIRIIFKLVFRPDRTNIKIIRKEDSAR